MRPLIHLRLFCLFVFLVVISSPGVLPAQTPVPDVTVNGADGEVTLVLPERLTVSFALDNKG